MALGLPASAASGDFKPIVKYDARAGRMFRIDRVESNGQFESVPTEITQGFAAVFDLANIEVGYVRFHEGGAPEWAMVKIGQPLPAKPNADFRQGFRCNIKLAKNSGGSVREFASAASCVIGAVDGLHTAYLAAPESKAGKLPIVSMTGTAMVKSGSGAKTSTNYAPTLVITGWIDRPADLAVDVRPVASSVAPPVSRPAPAQTPAPNDFDDDIPF